MSKRPIPVYTVGSPGAPSVKVTPDPNTPVYSSYSGEELGPFGSIYMGTLSDAPEGHPNHGKNYHGGILSQKHGKQFIMVHQNE